MIEAWSVRCGDEYLGRCGWTARSTEAESYSKGTAEALARRLERNFPGDEYEVVPKPGGLYVDHWVIRVDLGFEVSPRPDVISQTHVFLGESRCAAGGDRGSWFTTSEVNARTFGSREDAARFVRRRFDDVMADTAAIVPLSPVLGLNLGADVDLLSSNPRGAA